MKKMIEYLDADRDRVLTNLKTASSPADAQQILEKETDRLLLQYNEECTSLRVRDAAAGMVQALRSSVPFLDSMGEARLWQRDRAGSAGAGSGASSRAQGAGMSRILLGIGIILTAAAFAVPALSAGGTAALGSLLKGILLPLAGGGCLYFAGRTAGTNTRIRWSLTATWSSRRRPKSMTAGRSWLQLPEQAGSRRGRSSSFRLSWKRQMPKAPKWRLISAIIFTKRMWRFFPGVNRMRPGLRCCLPFQVLFPEIMVQMLSKPSVPPSCRTESS